MTSRYSILLCFVILTAVATGRCASIGHSLKQIRIEILRRDYADGRLLTVAVETEVELSSPFYMKEGLRWSLVAESIVHGQTYATSEWPFATIVKNGHYAVEGDPQFYLTPDRAMVDVRWGGAYALSVDFPPESEHSFARQQWLNSPDGKPAESLEFSGSIVDRDLTVKLHYARQTDEYRMLMDGPHNAHMVLVVPSPTTRPSPEKYDIAFIPTGPTPTESECRQADLLLPGLGSPTYKDRKDSHDRLIALVADHPGLRQYLEKVRAKMTEENDQGFGLDTVMAEPMKWRIIPQVLDANTGLMKIWAEPPGTILEKDAERVDFECELTEGIRHRHWKFRCEYESSVNDFEFWYTPPGPGEYPLRCKVKFNNINDPQMLVSEEEHEFLIRVSKHVEKP